jgi:hypothetical protein
MMATLPHDGMPGNLEDVALTLKKSAKTSKARGLGVLLVSIKSFCNENMRTGHIMWFF